MARQTWPPPASGLSPTRRWYDAGELVVINPYWNVGLSGGGQYIPALLALTPMQSTPEIRRQDGSTGLHVFRYLNSSAGSTVDRSLALTALSPSSITALYSDGNNGGASLPAGWMLGTNLNPIWLDAS